MPAPEGLPRLLCDVGDPPFAFQEHRRRCGALPDPGRRPRRELIEAVSRAGLRGKGGAAFPTGRKLQAVVEGSGRPVVVVNGAEGEPASGKDKFLLASAPHLVIDGALIAAAAVGASEVRVCVDRRATDALAIVRGALEERLALEGTPVPVRIEAVP